MLSERRAAILRLIVSDYVESAQPVGSENIVRRHQLEVSSATIRNEMARLEEEGFILQPHTSAGRVPSDRGYRYFVEYLMPDEDLALQEKRRILHQFYQATSEFHEWLGLAASVLARSVRNIALVTEPSEPGARVKHVQIVFLTETSALLVAVLQDVKVRERVMTLTEPVDQETLTQVASRLNDALRGADAPALVHAAHRLEGLEGQVTETLLRIVEEEDAGQHVHAHMEGVRELLAQPEFHPSEKMLSLMDVLDERRLPQALPIRELPEHGVAVVIGREHSQERMREFSLVLARYGAADGPGGCVAILGPTRMQYGRAIATVRYLSEIVTGLMERLYAS